MDIEKVLENVEHKMKLAVQHLYIMFTQKKYLLMPGGPPIGS